MIVSASAFTTTMASASITRSIAMIADASRFLVGLGVGAITSASSLTYNSANMTSAALAENDGYGGNSTRTRIAWLGDASLPAAGNYNIGFSGGGAFFVGVAGCVMKLIPQTAPVGYTATNAASIAITGIPSDAYILGACMTRAAGNPTLTARTGMTDVDNRQIAGSAGAYAWGWAQPGTANFTFGWTSSETTAETIAAIVVQVDTGSGMPIWF